MNNAYTKFYNPSKHLEVDIITVCFKGQDVLQSILLRTWRFQHKNFQILWIYQVHIWHEGVLGQGVCSIRYNNCLRHNKDLITRVEGYGHNCTWTILLLPLTNLWSHKGKRCGKTQQEVHATGPRCKNLKMKWGDIQARAMVDLTDMVQREQKRCLHVNQHAQSTRRQ